MKRRKKSSIFWHIFILIIILMSIVSFKPLFAYLAAKDTEINYIKPGFNISKIQEVFPEQGVLPVKGKTYEKKVSVKNEASVPCYIRVSVDYSDSRIGNAASLIGLNTVDWEYIGMEQPKLGGYYYYKKPVSPGQSTTNLFEGIRFSENMDHSFWESREKFDVILYEESVQQGDYTSFSKAWNDFIRE